MFAFEGLPCRLEYQVDCDSAWRTTAAKVVGVVGERRIGASVAVDGDVWRLNGVEHPQVDGCIDIDLGFSPSTNLLPIRRLALDVGKSADVRAAWLPFPSLSFEVLPQVYSREAERTYRYESDGGRFVRKLEVNDAGIVVTYPGLWETEATAG